MLSTVQTLCKHGLIRTTDEDGFGLQPLEAGKLMAQYSIRLGTMAAIVAQGPFSSQARLLELLSKAEEFKEIGLRRWVDAVLAQHQMTASCQVPVHSSMHVQHWQATSAAMVHCALTATIRHVHGE